MTELELQDVYPRLPEDLERLIFEQVAFECDPKDSMHLLIVAKRVHNWTRPILYRVFVQLDIRLFPNFMTNPSIKLDDVGRFPKHLIIKRPEDEIEALLSSCSNIYDLALWMGTAGPHAMSRFLPRIRDLPLTRLSTNLRNLTADQILDLPFSNLTHLDIIAFADSRWSSWAVLADLPKLSHMAIDFPVEDDVVSKLLIHCNNLKIMVLLFYDDEIIDCPGIEEIEDVRLVLMVAGTRLEMELDWIAGAYGRVDFWTTAEWFSEARKENLLLDSSQRWIKMKVDWENQLNDRGKEWFAN
ncbi:hypothetical protein GALMADRAFT_258068 [Galerina marginata CBS 339.88]|uniref:F-box domain-containing protein n=1 Tax=Galerina marginata (strain CBS 339.88) TaxID=685588 RepID=A0A067SIH1_GALM3|nr:hypothetical protein GALMADRAFT_258068 [Galerina marginata CBS 339.88]